MKPGHGWNRWEYFPEMINDMYKTDTPCNFCYKLKLGYCGLSSSKVKGCVRFSLKGEKHVKRISAETAESLFLIDQRNSSKRLDRKLGIENE
jgi:hypothetical protein